MKSLFTAILLFFVFAGQSQSLVSIAPSTGAAGTSVNVTITGSGTSFTNSTVFFLSSGASILTVSNVVAASATSAQATVTIPANATAGAYNLTTLAGFTPIQLSNAFTVTGGGGSGASISSIDPDEGYQGQFATITITGSNTTFTQSSGSSVTLVKGLGTPIASLGTFAIDDSSLMAYFSIPADAALGAYTVALTTSNNGILTKSNAFTIIENPLGQLTGVSPDQGEKGETLDVTISGSGTSFTQASSISVEFYGSSSGSMLMVNAAEAINDSTLLCNITIPQNSRTGAYDIYVLMDSSNMLQLTEGFTVIGDPNSEPRIVFVSPSTAYPGQILNVTITGANTHFSVSPENHMSAIFSMATYVEASSFSVINDSVMTAHFEIPGDFETGLYDFGVITDADGYLELLQSFTITEEDTITGVVEIKRSGLLQVYPNPVKNELNFVTDYSVIHVYITDVTGKQISIPSEDIRQYNKLYSIETDRYPVNKGIYFIRVETDQGVQTQKFIVE